jgi:hypothetical protein
VNNKFEDLNLIETVEIEVGSFNEDEEPTRKKRALTDFGRNY